MGIEERKAREQEKFRRLVVEKAYEMIQESGCSALTMRKLAKRIEWSTQKLYSNFSNKDELLSGIDAYLRERIWSETSNVPNEGEPIQYVLDLAAATLEFYHREPAAVEVLKEVRYSKERTPSAESDKAQKLFKDAFKALRCSALSTSEALEEALETVRIMLVGATECMQLVDSQKRKAIVSAAINGLRTLIKGWGYRS